MIIDTYVINDPRRAVMRFLLEIKTRHKIRVTNIERSDRVILSIYRSVHIKLLTRKKKDGSKTNDAS